MAKVYNVPDGFTKPVLNFQNIAGYRTECEEYLKRLKEWCIQRNPTQEYIGEIIKFPVADGYAEYMVAAIKPVQLIHIPLWDAWDFQYITRLNKKDIIEKIEQQKKVQKIFGGNQK